MEGSGAVGTNQGHAQSSLAAQNRNTTQDQKVGSIARGNLLTLLNAMGESLAGQNLSGQTIKDPNLEGANLEGLIAKDATIDGGYFGGAFLRSSNFDNSTLKGIDLGERPYDEIDWIPEGYASGSLNEKYKLVVLNQCYRGHRLGIWKIGQTFEPLVFSESPLKVYCSAISASYFALGGKRKVIQVWALQSFVKDPASQSLIRLETDRPRELTFSQSEKFLAAACVDSVQVWELPKGKELWKIEVERPNITLSPNDQLVAISEKKSSLIRLYQVKDGTLWKTLKGSGSPTVTLQFGSSTSLASGDKNQIISVWQLDRGECSVLGGGGGEIQTLEFLPGGERLLSVHQDSVRLWDPIRSTLIRTLPHPLGSVLGGTFLPGGDKLASVSVKRQGFLHIWDLDLQSPSNRFQEGHFGPVREIRIAPSGQYIVTMSDDQSICLWDGRQLGKLIAKTIMSSHIFSITFVPGEKEVLVGLGSYSEEFLQFLELPTLSFKERESTPYCQRLYFSPKGNLLCASASFGNRIQIWKFTQTSMPRLSDAYLLEGEVDGWTALNWSPTARLFVAVGHAPVIYFWEFSEKGKQGTEIPVKVGGSSGIVFSPSGDCVAAVGMHEVFFFNTSTKTQAGQPLKILEENPIQSFAFHPTEKIVISGNSFGELFFWNLDARELLGRIRVHQGPVNNLGFLNRGEYLVTGGSDSNWMIWELNLKSKEGEDWVKLKWRCQSLLECHGASFKGTKGLSSEHRKLLRQKGAVEFTP